ncbi:MAG: flagellar hook assembly protein FlgD, partial [Bauldia sp.]|nr:flagellar hook assembly protein FlgD [Bauldia sp.]
YEWDGRRSDGTLAEEGNYTITIAGVDSTGAPVSIKTAFGGVVDGVDLSGTEPILLLGGREVSLSSVKSIGQAPF